MRRSGAVKKVRTDVGNIFTWHALRVFSCGGRLCKFQGTRVDVANRPVFAVRGIVAPDIGCAWHQLCDVSS